MLLGEKPNATRGRVMPAKFAAWFYREKAREAAALLCAPMPPRIRYKGEEGLEQSQVFERYRLHLRQQRTETEAAE